MSIHLKAVTASKILELIEQFLSPSEQEWLSEQLSRLVKKPSALSLSQKQNLVDDLCGAWADDESITPIFSQIEQSRALNQPREVRYWFFHKQS